MSKQKQQDPYRLVLTQLILNAIAESPDEPVDDLQIATRLRLTDAGSLQVIRELLKSEALKGTLQESEKGFFAATLLKAQVTGIVDMASTGSAYIVSDESETDIYVAPRKLRNALHGDKVKVFVYAKQNGKGKEGEVVEIIERAKMEFAGIVKVSDRFAFLIPDSRKMLHDIFIPLGSLRGAKEGEKAVAKITEWPQGAKNPIGEIIQVLGKQGEHNTEMNAILAEFGFPLQFLEAVTEEAENISNQITDEEVALRRDFRNEITFTIDPFDAKDFDDALSFKRLENGHVEIGVHIADVSHYIVPQSALDKEAYERGTSVYLVDRVIPMLPEKLSNDLCSLKPNEDKLCFSAVFEMNMDSAVIKSWYGKTLIHSRRRFTYEEVQEIIESGHGDHAEILQLMNKTAIQLREERFQSGAINFESTEVKFILNGEGKPTGVYIKERKDAHKLVEEFMLLANKKVAEFVATKGDKAHPLTFIYRAHDQPDPEILANFSHFAARFGYKINTKSHKEISKSMNKLLTDIEGKKEQNVLTQLAIRSMAKAVYTTKRTGHYGLAFDYYTHFTSPIRRYPDVLAHRLLYGYLNGSKSVNASELETLCAHSSQMEKKAADAERASVKYKQAEYLHNQIGSVYRGIVSGVTEWGMYVEIIENKCEGMIRLRDMDDDFYILDQPNYCIIGQKKKKTYQLGDEVTVKVKSVDIVKKQIDLVLTH